MNFIPSSLPPREGPLELMFLEIERALDAGLFYLAVAMSLTLPDICAALESPNGEASGPKYKAWFNANLARYFPDPSLRAERTTLRRNAPKQILEFLRSSKTLADANS